LFVGISLCSSCAYVHFTYFDIGFVLRNEAGFLILDPGFLILDTGFSIFDAGPIESGYTFRSEILDSFPAQERGGGIRLRSGLRRDKIGFDWLCFG